MKYPSFATSYRTSRIVGHGRSWALWNAACLAFTAYRDERRKLTREDWV